MFILMIVVVAVHRTAQNSVCNTSNPFLAQLRRSSIGFLPSPNYQSQKCPYEWGVHGTCCDQDRMVQWAKQDSKQIGFAVETTGSFIKRYQNFIQDLSNLLQRASPNGVKYGNPKIQLFWEVIQGAEVKSAIEKLAEMDKKINLENCWTQLSTIRSNSICTFCSARWASFFTKYGEKKVLLSKEACESAIKPCKNSFLDLVEFIELVDKINKPLKEAFDEIDRPAAATIEFFHTVQKWVKEIKEKNIKSLISSNESTMNVQLCEISLQVFGKPLIEKLATGLLTGLNDKMQDLIRRLKQKIDPTTSGSRLRLLQSDLNSNFGINDQLFVGDVKVMANTDSSYTSYFGATGTSGNENSMHMDAMPLNITSKFL